MCVSATGAIIPPMHIFPGERFSYNPLAGGVEGAYFGKSPSGWMTQELFNGWISNHFIRHISCESPVCLIVDGHSSHIDLDTSKFCEANDVLLYCLPPHSSHVTQPLDVGFFSPLKKNWQQAVVQFQQETGETVTKQTFARVFRSAYMKSLNPTTIVNSFRSSGIYPPNRLAINDKKLGPSQQYIKGKSNTEGTKQHETRPCGEEMALQALENAMDASTLTKYSKRYEEGYDIQDDVLYNTWVKLKKAVPNILSKSSNKTELETNQPLGDITNQLKDVLKLPEPRQPKMTTRGTTMLPKHISGEEMIRFLEEKRNKKLQEEEEKSNAN